MTVARRDNNDLPFNDWIRHHPCLNSKDQFLSLTDSDLWVHRYSLRNEKHRRKATDTRQVIDNIMLVEIKTFSKNLPYAQKDTLSVIDGLLRKACVRKDGRRQHVKIHDSRRVGRKRLVRCFGVHVLQLSHDRPDRSHWILWDGNEISMRCLVETLRFDRDPDAPSRRLDTRRHHRPTQMELYPALDLTPNKF